MADTWFRVAASLESCDLWIYSQPQPAPVLASGSTWLLANNSTNAVTSLWLTRLLEENWLIKFEPPPN